MATVGFRAFLVMTNEVEMVEIGSQIKKKATLDKNIVHRGKRVENGFARYSRHSYTTIMIW